MTLPRRSQYTKIAATLLSLLVAVGAGAREDKPVTIKALPDFEQCLQDYYTNDKCLRALDAYVKNRPGEAMSAGRLVRRHFHAHMALPYFEVAQKAKAEGQAFCKDEDVRLAVLSGLALPGDYVNAERARRVFSGACYAEQEGAVLADLGNERGASYLKDNACPILKKHGKSPDACAPTPPAPVAAEPEARLPQVDKSAIRLGVIKAYRGTQGEQMTLAAIKEGELYLARFDGVEGPWAGRTLLFKRDDRGAGKADYWTTHDGKRWVGIVERGSLTVYLPGARNAAGFHVGYSDTATKAVEAKNLLDAF